MNFIRISKMNALRLSKCFLFIYFLFSKVLMPLGYVDGIITYLILVILFLSVLYMDKMKLRLDRIIKLELIFLIITITTGIIVSNNQDLVNNTAETLIFGIVSGYCIIRIAQKDDNIVWIIKTWIFMAIILAVYIFFTGGYINRTGRLTINEGFNTNTLSVYMMFALWGALFLLTDVITNEIKNKYKIILYVVCSVMFFYVIISTASRKALLSAIFVLLFWIVFGLIPIFKKITFQNKLLVFILLTGSIIGIAYLYGPQIVNNSDLIVYRMQRLSNGGILEINRYYLILDAIRVFTENPIVGVGWNNYQLVSEYKLISHNSYVEILACTGIIGSLLFFYLLVLLIKRIIQNVKHYQSSHQKANILSLMGIFLFICSVQVLFYNSNLLIIFHILIVLADILEKKKNQEGI